MPYKPTVCFDFDGVIHMYTSPWTVATEIRDEPVPGIKEEIDRIRAAGYKVVTNSARCETPEGQAAVASWLKDHNIVVDAVTATKPAAIVYLDDRALRFTGDPSDLLEQIQAFKPWNR